jgi:hypothetical protein
MAAEEINTFVVKTVSCYDFAIHIYREVYI